MPIDPEAGAYLDNLTRLGIRPVNELTPEQAREVTLSAWPMLAGEMEPVARREDRTIPGPQGPIPIRLLAPAADGALPVLLYLHGGGWVTGNLDTHEVVCRGLANRAGCLVVAVDFRSAPDHRFPAAVEDSWAALEWVAGLADSLGGDASRLAVAGDSAGGNLAAVLALRARSRGGPELRQQVLIYPVTDHDFDTPSYRTNATGYALTRDGMRWYWDHYAPDAGRRGHPDASPLRAPDHTGVAPALIIVCEFDPLLDEGVAYAEALRHAGVPVRLIREEGMIHGYIRMPALISRARKSWDDIAAALREAFRESTVPTR